MGHCSGASGRPGQPFRSGGAGVPAVGFGRGAGSFVAMATKTPIPPGPPPRGFQWPDQPPQGSITPLGSGPTGSRTVVVQPGRHGVTVFVGIIALIVGLVFGFQLGRGADSSENASATDTSSDTTIAGPTLNTTPPTTPTTGGGPASLEPLGTLENPIPMGQSWILGIWQLEVRSADLDAADTVVAASGQNPTPSEGSVYVLIDIELTAVEDLFITADDFLPGIRLADGTELPAQFRECGPAVPDDFYANGRLRKDTPVRGNLCFEVPADATDGLLLTTDGVSDTKTYFALEEN